MLGITTSSPLYPLKKKLTILNSESTKSTKNKVIALVKNLNTPKVSKFKGSKSKFIIGRTNKDATARAREVISKLLVPFLKTRPVVIKDTPYKTTASITKIRINLFTKLMISWTMKRFSIVFVLFFSLILIFLSIPLSSLAYYTNMPASIVLGQPDFVSNSANQGGSAAANTLNTVQGVATDGSRLFVSDGTNNRVLIWNKIPTQNNTPADVVLGQTSFTSTTANSGGISASSLNSPTSVFVYNGKLFVADGGNTRVLIWNTLPTSNKQPADLVVGQVDFTASTFAATDHNFAVGTSLATIFIYQNKLFIGDASGHRVLIFNQVPTTNGASADLVVGQTDFSSTTTGTDASHFGIASSVRGLAVYNNRLIVGDNGNQRVLIFNQVPTTNGASADVVIGQPNMTSSGADNGGISCGTIEGIPGNILVTSSGRLLIPDDGRLLIFNQIPGSNFQTADLVLGKPDCVTRTPGVSDKLTDTRIRGVTEFNQKLYVSDAGNFRILIFPNTITTPSINLTTPPTSIGSGRYRITGNINMNNNGGTYSLQTLSADLNGTGYGSISFAGGRSDGSGNTIYDFIYDFDPLVGGGDINTNLTLKFLASTFNADTNTLFYFLPFKLKLVASKQIVFNVNKLQLSKIKDNISHFEVWTKTSSSSLWTKYIDNILPTQIDTNGDVYISKLNSLTSISYKIKAIDNWNNSEESNILSFSSSSVPVTNFVNLTGSPTFSPEPSSTPLESPISSPEPAQTSESNEPVVETKANNFPMFIIPIGIGVLLLFTIILLLKKKLIKK